MRKKYHFKFMRQCYFCTNNIKVIDYKNIEILKRFLDSFSRIVPAKESGTCTKHQRKLSRAVKNARIMALLPFVTH
ncbi:30S ribosomal protein S18 [Patescibacteria group bacterium]|nr:30S ribosomal protein S18 [Patescibacteria group bacterium]MBU2219276.1 30S ribosomal protein S18 [Patescibacteria group bacterium]MBU2263565.1 30S ribosomal protein S18 [Patescibacteria group bacterium]